jgi:signal transduction histidine kinase
VKQFSFTSLRSRAIYLVLLAILPLSALTLYSYVHHRQAAVSEVQRDELVAARNLAAIQENLIGSTRQLLTALGEMSPVQGRDPEGCKALFTALLKQSPHYTVIEAVDPEGRVFAAAPAASGPSNIADQLCFKKAVQTRGFFVGEPVLNRLSGKYSLNMSCPVLDPAGRLQGVVVIGVDLSWLGGLLAKSELPPGTALVLSDSSEKVLFRYPEPQKYIGRMLPEAVIRSLSSGDEGVAEGVGLPGDSRLFAFVRLSPPWQEMLLFIGLPRDLALIEVNRELWKNLTWLLAVGLLAMAAAWYGGGWFIIRPVWKLRSVTARLAEGDLTARAGLDYRVGELGDLAQAFDQMAEALQERDAELVKAAAALQEQVAELNRRSLELAAANQELEAFTYSVSHDLRAPLRAIGGFARVLLEDYPDKLDPDGQRYLQVINQNAARMGQLIDDLLTLSRLGRKEMRPVRLDMTALAQEVWAELRTLYPERDLQIEIQELPAAWGDRLMMRQLLTNLLENAIKFTTKRQPAVIRVSGWSEAQEQVYCVRDNGVGFNQKYVHKLFEVFQRLHPEAEYEGTGVGLAIVRRIIERHGGRLWAEGQVDAGAAFYFALPQKNLT